MEQTEQQAHQLVASLHRRTDIFATHFSLAPLASAAASRATENERDYNFVLNSTQLRPIVLVMELFNWFLGRFSITAVLEFGQGH